jgi:DNA-binding protein H-NS
VNRDVEVGSKEPAGRAARAAGQPAKIGDGSGDAWTGCGCTPRGHGERPRWGAEFLATGLQETNIQAP